MNGKSYTKNVSVTVNQFKTAKDYVAANVEVTYPDGKVWIPESFRIAKDSASKVQDGVVIEDKDENQFVWVPVATIADYKRTWYTGDGSFSDYSEALPEDEKTSVERYKGFYIGRYEAGDKENTEAKTLRSSNDVTKTVTIKANQAPYNYVTRTQAKSLAEGFATKQGYKAKTKLVSSYAWDTTIAFLQKVNSDYGSSSEEGNYSNTTFSYTDITGASKTKAKSSYVLVQQDKQLQYVIFMIWEETLMSGRLSPIRTRAVLMLDVEAVTASVSRVILPVVAISILTMPTLTLVSGSLYLARSLSRAFNFNL